MARYLVTGGAGFIGSHVVERLVSDGHAVRILDDLSTGRLENLDAVRPHIEFIEGDIRDREAVRRAVHDAEYIIHEAAWASVPKSMEDPLGYTEVNVIGTANLLDAAVSARMKRLVFVSSSSVYGQSGHLPLREDHPLHPISPYAASKLAAELYCGLYSRAFGLETVVVRYFNVFGPRQRLDSEYAVVVPKFITCLLRGEPAPIYGDGQQARDFTYVENVVEATILASQVPGVSGETFNVALGQAHAVLGLWIELNRIVGCSIPPSFQPPRPGDIQRSLADPSKAMRLLRWRGRVGFSEGLRRTLEWFHARSPSERKPLAIRA